MNTQMGTFTWRSKPFWWDVVAVSVHLWHSIPVPLLQIFLVLSQVARLGVPFAVMLFAEYGGSIAPYFVLRFVDSAFGYVHFSHLHVFLRRSSDLWRYFYGRTASVSSAAVADVVSPANRAAAFGILFATFMIGYCISAGIAPLFSRVRLLRNACRLRLGLTSGLCSFPCSFILVVPRAASFFRAVCVALALGDLRSPRDATAIKKIQKDKARD